MNRNSRSFVAFRGISRTFCLPRNPHVPKFNLVRPILWLGPGAGDCDISRWSALRRSIRRCRRESHFPKSRSPLFLRKHRNRCGLVLFHIAFGRVWERSYHGWSSCFVANVDCPFAPFLTRVFPPSFFLWFLVFFSQYNVCMYIGRPYQNH